MCRRRILFAGFVARHGGHETAEVRGSENQWGARDVFGGRKKEWMGCLRAFGINADQWAIAARDEREWRKTAELGAERFMAKLIAAENVRAGLRHVVVCPNVTGGGKERIAQSKRARAGSARHS